MSLPLNLYFLDCVSEMALLAQKAVPINKVFWLYFCASGGIDVLSIFVHSLEPLHVHVHLRVQSHLDPHLSYRDNLYGSYSVKRQQ